MDQVEKLAAIMCTEPEIASVVGVSFTTWKRRKNEDPELSERVASGRERGKASLRRMQWKAAEAGNPTMQIWLGKNHLAQTDKNEVSVPQAVSFQMIAPDAEKKAGD
jgi:hypothetical protein|tara:strand:- start:130 stop:450 length:321 start_codon:yes stop_codon:yes gene_type:complete